MERYFAYGSNLSTRQMVARCPSARTETRAVLRGYRLCFPRTHRNWPGGVAGLMACDGASVEGVIYRLTRDDLLRLDEFENVRGGSYSRHRLEVGLPDGGVETAWVYMAHPDEGGPFAPSQRYLATILLGAREHGLSEEHIRFIESFAVEDAGPGGDQDADATDAGQAG